jgi:coniferyl-aldehyde dehydrogenase
MEDTSQLPALLDRLRRAQESSPYPVWSERVRRLRALEALLRDNRREITDAIDADFGKRPAEETALLEYFPLLTEIRHLIRHGRRWLRPQRQMASFWFLPARTELRPQPVGVVGIIAPWNYPLYLAAGPLANALVAGNRALVKMSEFVPRFADLFAGLVERYFPDGEVRVVTGDAEVGKAFAALPFDHLLFTGSTVVGHDVMRAAAANLTPVTLELGGKSPAIIGPGARMDNAVDRILMGKSYNAGQTCIAPDYVLLPREREQEFIGRVQKRFRSLYPDFPNNRQYANIVNDRHYARLTHLRDQAIANGARMHSLADAEGQGRHLAPAVFTQVDPESDLMQEEIFGPWLPLVPYDTFEEALNFVASRPSPLALYLFDEDAKRKRQTLERCPAGGVTFNDTLFHIAQPHLPFGGVGPSGMGAYHGESGFRLFSRMTPIFHQSRLNAANLLNPPYENRFKWLLKQLIR